MHDTVLPLLLAVLAAWVPGHPEYRAQQGIGKYDDMLEAVDRVDAEARGWLDGMEHHTGFCESKLEEAACKLWCFTASPEPLVGAPPFALSPEGRWAAVAEGYRALVREAQDGAVPFEVFVRRNLRATAEASGGPRADQASHVLDWWLFHKGTGSLAMRRRRPTSSFWLNGYVPSAGRGRAIHGMHLWWFDRNERQLTWDIAARQFTGPGGRPLPDIGPTDAAVAAEEAKGDPAGHEQRSPGPPPTLDGVPADATPAGLAAGRVPPVVYMPRFRPEPLDAQQTREILRFAAAFQPKGRPVWFVLVWRNRTRLNGKWDRGIVVHYAPDETGDRLLKGRSAHLGSGASLRRYAHVSAAGRPFDDRLTVPDTAGLPFNWPPVTHPEREPVAVDDADLVTAIDLARAALGGHAVARDEPILQVEIDGDEFVVRSGWSAGSSGGGRGHMVRIKRVRGRLKATGVTWWVS